MEDRPAAKILADIAQSMGIQNKREEEEKAGRIGALQSITKDDDLKILGARGRGHFQVAICPEDVGRNLVKALLRLAEHSLALCKHHRWPTPVNYGNAHGLATDARGGKSACTMASWAVGVADWATCPEEMLDDYVPSAEYKIEARPKQPTDTSK